MALTNPQPPIIDGVPYPFLGFQLAISTHISDGQSGPYMEASICCSLFPYRESANGPVLLSQEGSSGMGGLSIVYSRALAAAQEGDAAVANYLAEVQAAAQKYINTKV